MKAPSHLLLIAPSAPPKNSPEAMQVGRFLAALDPAIRVTLVTTPIGAGWARADDSLVTDRPGMQVIILALPFHRFSHRVLSNWRLSRLHVPDADHWLPWLAGQVLAQMDGKPDVIYSRSAPFSAALLALALKRRLRIPWLMHLSDPWAGSPYRILSPQSAEQDRRREAECFATADLITLTTEGQAAHYRARYPHRMEAIHMTPNMMPVSIPSTKGVTFGEQLRVVYTGAFYWPREPSTVLSALRLLRERHPETAGRIVVHFYGNASPEIYAQIEAEPACIHHGPVPFAEAACAQARADILLTIEPDGQNPLLLHFMPSKNLDYIASGKPLLAITPTDSETANLCARGFGWSVAPGEIGKLANLLHRLVLDHVTGNPKLKMPDLTSSPYHAQTVARDIWERLSLLISHGDIEEA